MEHSLYKFGAKDPLSVLRVQMERHSDSTSWSNESQIKLFTKNEVGEFSLLSESPANNKEEQVKTTNSLELVHQLANKLKQDTIQRIIDHLYSLEPEEFEFFCKRFLDRYGFENMQVTQRGRDGGIDVHGQLEVGISMLHVAAQCKRYKKTNKVSRPDIDMFRGAIQGEYQQGIFITTSSFTKEAQDSAFKRGCVPIVLIDGETLAEIMIERGIGVSTSHIPIYDFELDLV
ncbi:restriction endonuclease [Pseudoalteromonas aurantia]|uniref:Restriction endonuclease n=2 Tax=Pseudoalteromonas aurantia TaxID=43654 RepID=A0ABY2VWC6_9GAMM|nr:restriction endonuclease [Pseudoalteromonas aurantia]